MGAVGVDRLAQGQTAAAGGGGGGGCGFTTTLIAQGQGNGLSLGGAGAFPISSWLSSQKTVSGNSVVDLEFIIPEFMISPNTQGVLILFDRQGCEGDISFMVTQSSDTGDEIWLNGGYDGSTGLFFDHTYVCPEGVSCLTLPLSFQTGLVQVGNYTTSVAATCGTCSSFASILINVTGSIIPPYGYGYGGGALGGDSL